MNKNELDALAISLLATDNIADIIADGHDQATDDENGFAIAAGSLIEDYRELNDISDEDAFDLEEIICEMMINGESAND
jgi:hypothetical protein